MGEKSKRTQAASAAVMRILERAAAIGDVAVFRGYAEAAGAVGGPGGWVYPTPSSSAAAHGWQKFAQVLANGAYASVFADIVKQYEATMPDTYAAAEPPTIGQDLDVVDERTRQLQDGINAMLENMQALAGQMERALRGDVPTEPDPAETDNAVELTDRIVRRAGYVALKAVLTTLDGWIEGNRENAANGVQISEPERFYANDIRAMLNDTARDLGIPLPYQDPS